MALPSSYPSLARLRELLAEPVDALPLDVFRVLVGALAFAYFLCTLFEAGDFSGPDGLIDHELSRGLFWFTRLSLFRPGMSLSMFQAVFIIACVCSCALIIGYRVKTFAAILYLIAVCTYRWNFLVMYVDDSIVHLTLFWLLLLPVGRTLVLSEWRVNRGAAWRRWKCERVPGAAARCFMLNLALIYVVAGLWKWDSPMWRDGVALYAILKLPISLAPGFWGPEHASWLRVLNYCALILEPLFLLIFILPRGHLVKYGLLLALVGFHVGTLATLRIPFANIACLAAMIVPFGGELMDRLRGGVACPQPQRAPARIGRSGAFALLFVAVLALAMLSSMPLPQWRAPTRRGHVEAYGVRTDAGGVTADKSRAACCATGGTDTGGAEGLGPLQMTFFSSLWCVGIAQQYQLFNWIDERNYTVRYRVVEYEGGAHGHEIEPGSMFLESTRGVLLQFYLHGLTWMRVEPGRAAELRRSIQTRTARRYCRRFQPRGVVVVYSTMERVVPGGVSGGESTALLMRFSCDGGEPVMQDMNLDP
jgi:hypothetical protein